MLNEDDKARLRAEEMFRNSIQEELALKKPKPSAKSTLWMLLNSAFGLWLLSTLAVGFITWSYATYKESKTADNQKRELLRKLDTEITYRISQCELALAYVSCKEIGRGGPLTKVVSAPLDGKATFVTPTPYVYPEFKERGFVSLVAELTSVLGTPDKEQMDKVVQDYNKIISLSSPESAEGCDQRMTEMQKLVREELRRPRWRIGA